MKMRIARNDRFISANKQRLDLHMKRGQSANNSDYLPLQSHPDRPVDSKWHRLPIPAVYREIGNIWPAPHAVPQRYHSLVDRDQICRIMAYQIQIQTVNFDFRENSEKEDQL